MKTAAVTLLAFGLSFLVVYVGVKLRKRKGKDFEPKNNFEDQSKNYFV